MRKRSLLAATAGVAAGVLIAGGVAFATIPGGDGVINGCYEKRTGILRVIDAEAGRSCLSFESPISWNRMGPQGAQGVQGLKGDAGPQGPKGDEGDTGATGPAGISGYERITVDGVIRRGEYVDLRAECPAGKKLLGGGWNGAAEGSVVSSGPLEGVPWIPEAWRGVFFGSSPLGNFQVRVYAMCASVD